MPTDARITVREIPTQVAAAKAFTGRWTERIYQDQLADLRRAVTLAGLKISGPPLFALFFDPPCTPRFLRHNEVVLPVTEDPTSARPSA